MSDGIWAGKTNQIVTAERLSQCAADALWTQSLDLDARAGNCVAPQCIKFLLERSALRLWARDDDAKLT